MPKPYSIATIHIGDTPYVHVWMNGRLTIPEARMLARELLLACTRAEEVQTAVSRREPGPEASTVGEVDPK